LPFRQIRFSLSFVATLLAFFLLAANPAQADESLRIARPLRTQPEVKAEASTANPAAEPVQKTAAQRPVKAMDCGGSCCKGAAQLLEGINCPLPPPGLFEQWRAEFVNPTLCPILMCHGSCRRSQMSCKFIKPLLDSLLDAYVPEEPPPLTVVNFRCCAGFTDE